MSKVGKKPIILPAWVTLSLQDENITVTGPKGTLKRALYPWVSLRQEWESIILTAEWYEMRKFWWLMRSLVQNMIIWVDTWYTKKMLVFGVGYTAKPHGVNGIEFTLGLSHKVHHQIPSWITLSFEKDQKGNDILLFQSYDKELLGEACARVRAIKPPEPYKWAGIRFTDEVIKLKPGKAAAK